MLISPFFLSAKIIATIFHLPAQAYAETFQKSVSIAALFYLFLGFWFLIRLCRSLNIKRINSFISLLLILFATNLLTYSIFHPAMSHVYSFCAISGFLWAINQNIITGRNIFLLISSVILGIVYLIRPVNIIIVAFVPFFFSDLSEMFLFLKTRIKHILIFLGIFILLCFLQNILWFLQCGSFLIDVYPHEGFYWLHPEIFKVLFSFRKGLFIYSPAVFFSLLGLISIFKMNKFKALIGLFFILILVYLISSWWCWSYFDGFGMRPFIDFYGVLALFLAFLFNNIQKWLRYFFIICVLFPISLNLIQTYQYTKGIIHPDYMNLSAYRYVFLKTSNAYINRIGGSNDIVPYNKYKKNLIYESIAYPEASAVDTSNTIIPKGETEMAFIYNHKIPVNFLLQFDNDTSLINSNKLFAEIALKKRELSPCKFSDDLLVVSIKYNDNHNTFYRSFPLDYLPIHLSNKWEQLDYRIILPAIQSENYQLKFYIWNKGLDNFLIKDIHIKIYKTN